MIRLPVPQLILATGMLMAVAASAMAQTTTSGVAWKWKDSNGQIQFSDRPPPSSVPAKDILVRPASQPTARANVPAPGVAAVSASAAASSERVDPELEARRKKLADEQLAQQKAQEARNDATRAENCTGAKGHLTALSEGQRMARTNEQGERVVLDDKARAEEMQRARAIVASNCK